MMIHQLRHRPSRLDYRYTLFPQPVSNDYAVAGREDEFAADSGGAWNLGGLAIGDMPVFADFLIATEAEINKVSWTPRAQLVKDTIVVLIVTFIITLFLFLVDVFWFWILSRELINVLPSDAEQQNNKQVDIGKLEY